MDGEIERYEGSLVEGHLTRGPTDSHSAKRQNEKFTFIIHFWPVRIFEPLNFENVFTESTSQNGCSSDVVGCK